MKNILSLKFCKCHKIAYRFYSYLAGLRILSFDLCLMMFMKLSLLSVSGLEDCRIFRQGFRLFFLFSELALFFTIF
ncbi:unnamed protein product [Gongylonema pulchrum]|uniref:Uncharacterized protein n=1 Tax=Gongylonema pulchrum TaxID=637853 RepID=A0A3P7M5T2_9BILA|nr:unnamed protein product [Gongylonema pulchrum]